MSYKIVRFYRDNDKRNGEVVKRGLTLEEARAHCSDPQTHSKECTTKEGIERTKKYGPWFEGYSEE